MTESDRPSGQVVVEIKMSTTFCVPLAEEEDALEALADAVLGDIRLTRMVDQVTIESFSPEILDLVADQELDIPPMLAVDALQLLAPEWIEANTPHRINTLEGKGSFFLPWGEVGVIYMPGVYFYRLPGCYARTPDETPLGNYIRTLYLTGSSIASLDKQVLFMAPSMGSSAASVVEALHGTGFSVLVFTIEHGQEFLWVPVSAAGVDGIFIDDIPAGLVMEGH